MWTNATLCAGALATYCVHVAGPAQDAQYTSTAVSFEAVDAAALYEIVVVDMDVSPRGAIECVHIEDGEVSLSVPSSVTTATVDGKHVHCATTVGYGSDNPSWSDAGLARLTSAQRQKSIWICLPRARTTITFYVFCCDTLEPDTRYEYAASNSVGGRNIMADVRRYHPPPPYPSIPPRPPTVSDFFGV